MAEENANQNGNDDSSTMKTVGIIVVVLLLIALLFYFLGGDSDSDDITPENGGSKVEKPTTPTTPTSPTISPAARAKAMVELAKFQALSAQIEDTLTEQGQKNLVVVLAYLEDNPETITEETPTESTDGTTEESTEIPQEVYDAYDQLQEELSEEGVFDDDYGIGDVEQEVVDEISVGSEYTLQGTLQVVMDIDEDLNHMYKLMNNADGNWYYFIFDNETSEQAAALVGSEVTVDVVVTEVLEDKVMYDVVSGPTAVN